MEKKISNYDIMKEMIINLSNFLFLFTEYYQEYYSLFILRICLFFNIPFSRCTTHTFKISGNNAIKFEQ